MSLTLGYGGPNIKCHSNLQRLIAFLLYQSFVEEQYSDTWIHLSPSIIEILSHDKRLGNIAHDEIEVLQWREGLDRGQSQQLEASVQISLIAPRLRSIIFAAINTHPKLEERGLTMQDETILQTLRSKQNRPSTFDKLVDALNGLFDPKNPFIESKIDLFDLQVSFALAVELVRRKRFKEALGLLHSIVDQLDTLSCCHQCRYLTAVIELVKCCNLLNRELEGKAIALKALACSLETWDPADLCKLRIVLADSLIGQRRYGKAEEILVGLPQDEHLSAYIHTVANLRLNTIRRRRGTLTTLSSFDGLSEAGTEVLDPRIAAAIKDEYCSEISATLSSSDVLQTLSTGARVSVKFTQDLLLQSKSRKNDDSMMQICSNLKGIQKDRSILELRQIMNRIKEHWSHDEALAARKLTRQKRAGTFRDLPSISVVNPYSSEPADPAETLLMTWRQSLRGLLTESKHSLSKETKFFLRSLQIKIFPSESEMRHAIVLLLPGWALEGSEDVWAREIGNRQPGADIIVIRSPQWTERNESTENLGLPELLTEHRDLLMTFTKSILISEGGLSPRELVLIGYCHGAKVALAIAAIWDDEELGGVVMIESLRLTHLEVPQIRVRRSKTAVLVVRGATGSRDSLAMQELRSNFDTVDICILETMERALIDADETKKALLKFLGHRLRDEWRIALLLSGDFYLCPIT